LRSNSERFGANAKGLRKKLLFQSRKEEEKIGTKPMTDPLTAATIATLIVTKVLEKQGEKVGEKVWAKGEQLLALLQRKALDTASAIEKAAQQPALTAQQPVNLGEATLIGEVEQLAAADPEIKAAVEAVAAEAKAQPETIQNLTKLAEKIGVVNLGSITNQTNTINL
jgi:hypothetical protein